MVLIRTGFGYVSIIYSVDTNLLFLEVFFFGDKMKKCEQTGLFNKCF
ncbi:hypothetical protein BACOVA_03451 [Bacteroides ovatus ATCC 8483]|uniref:Uncharacterized protein n=1 Tax=Bacteroides ovatus (strain ATCC 8483 / DSM 1896 / JCM 5824 / BCRC 10623 / CCUG 4943 / NCTC 11153) TaxID=411476 RepID=A0AAN3D8Q8_BACO1|nr:hypothetical protein BACOVA_03451 [Bacteroides ovatus ATCC 8483]